MTERQSRRRGLRGRAALVLPIALAIASCAFEEDETRDFEEAPTGEASSELVAYNCATHTDTGYTNGKAFILPESSPEAAAALLEKFRARLAQTTASPHGFEAQDKYLGRLCVFQKGRYLVGAANFPAGVDPRPLASALLERLP